MVLDQIKKILVETMDIEEEKVTLDAKLKDDLNLDSLDSVELIMSAEEEFGIEIPDEDVMNFKTVNDIVNYIEAHKKVPKNVIKSIKNKKITKIDKNFKKIVDTPI